jgi:hypothetical protein
MASVSRRVLRGVAVDRWALEPETIISAEADEVRKSVLDFRCVPDRKAHKCAGGGAQDGGSLNFGKDQLNLMQSCI